MIDNIEDWLNSLDNVEVHDLSESSSMETSEPEAESPAQVSNVVAVNEDTNEEINTEPQPMPNDEFAELLSNIGYAPSSEQAEFEVEANTIYLKNYLFAKRYGDPRKWKILTTIVNVLKNKCLDSLNLVKEKHFA